MAYSNNQRIFVGAIAAGEKVVASRGGTVARFLRKHYSDVLAVDMEGRGFLEAVHINPDVKGCVIRVSPTFGVERARLMQRDLKLELRTRHRLERG